MSTGRQTLSLADQLEALTRHGIDEEHTVVEVASGAAARPLLGALLLELRPGDHLVVCRLDRLGRSVTHLAELVGELNASGVAVVSLADGLRSDTAGGRLLLHVLAAAAEYERELLRERTAAALATAKRNGVKLGRPLALGAIELRAVRAQVAEGASVADLARQYHCSTRTLWRHLREG